MTIAQRRRAMMGAVSKEINISDTMTWSKGSPAWLGLAENSATTTGRLISNGVNNITRIVSTDTSITYAVAFVDSNGKVGKVLTTDGEIVTTTTFNGQQALLYHAGVTIVPLEPQTVDGLKVRVMARKGTGNNIAVTDAQYMEVWQK